MKMVCLCTTVDEAGNRLDGGLMFAIRPVLAASGTLGAACTY
jgi:hypothetical protein